MRADSGQRMRRAPRLITPRAAPVIPGPASDVAASHGLESPRRVGGRPATRRRRRRRARPTAGHGAGRGRPAPAPAAKPSIAQALGVTQPSCCSHGGIRKRGTMLPPTADATSTAMFDASSPGARCAQSGGDAAASSPAGGDGQRRRHGQPPRPERRRPAAAPAHSHDTAKMTAACATPCAARGTAAAAVDERAPRPAGPATSRSAMPEASSSWSDAAIGTAGQQDEERRHGRRRSRPPRVDGASAPAARRDFDQRRRTRRARRRRWWWPRHQAPSRSSCAEAAARCSAVSGTTTSSTSATTPRSAASGSAAK